MDKMEKSNKVRLTEDFIDNWSESLSTLEVHRMCYIQVTETVIKKKE